MLPNYQNFQLPHSKLPRASVQSSPSPSASVAVGGTATEAEIRCTARTITKSSSSGITHIDHLSIRLAKRVRMYQVSRKCSAVIVIPRYKKQANIKHKKSPTQKVSIIRHFIRWYRPIIWEQVYSYRMKPLEYNSKLFYARAPWLISQFFFSCKTFKVQQQHRPAQHEKTGWHIDCS